MTSSIDDEASNAEPNPAYRSRSRERARMRFDVLTSMTNNPAYRSRNRERARMRPDVLTSMTNNPARSITQGSSSGGSRQDEYDPPPQYTLNPRNIRDWLSNNPNYTFQLPDTDTESLNNPRYRSNNTPRRNTPRRNTPRRNTPWRGFLAGLRADYSTSIWATNRANAATIYDREGVSKRNREFFWRHYFKFPFVLAVIINLLAIISLPWLPGTTVYLVETDFNQNAFDGTLNGITVLKMSKLRLGIWAACYSDLKHDNTCLHWGLAYQVTITDANNAHAVVAPLWTAVLKVQALAGFLTLVACVYSIVYSCLDEEKQNGFTFWYAFVAMLFTASVLAVDGLLLRNVENVTQTFGEGVKTRLGPGFGWVALALILIFGGCACHCWEDKKLQTKKTNADKQKVKDERAARLAGVGIQRTEGEGYYLA